MSDADMISNQSPGAQHASASAPIQQVSFKFGFDPATMGVIISLLLVIAGCGVVMGLYISSSQRAADDYRAMKTQQWLLERRLMDREALDIVNGTKLPSDDEHGATGNLQRMRPKEK